MKRTHTAYPVAESTAPTMSRLPRTGLVACAELSAASEAPATPATANSMAMMVLRVSFSLRNSHAATAVQRGKQAAMTPPCEAVV